MTKLQPRDRAPKTPRKAISPKLRLEVLLKCGGRCAKCDAKLGRTFDVDHILPISMGGLHEVGNMEALCEPCHAEKTKADISRYAKCERQAKMFEPKEPSRLQGRGFDRTKTRGFDGRVRSRARKHAEDAQP